MQNSSYIPLSLMEMMDVAQMIDKKNLEVEKRESLELRTRNKEEGL